HSTGQICETEPKRAAAQHCRRSALRDATSGRPILLRTARLEWAPNRLTTKTALRTDLALVREQAVRDETQSELARERALRTNATRNPNATSSWVDHWRIAVPCAGGRAAAAREKLNSSQPARARRLDEGAGRLAVALVLSRGAVRMGYPGWDMAPAIAALHRR